MYKLTQQFSVCRSAQITRFIYRDLVTLSKTVTTLSTSSGVNSQLIAMRMLQRQTDRKQRQRANTLADFCLEISFKPKLSLNQKI